MRKTLTLAGREITGYFFSPLGYIIMALFLLSSGLFFFYNVLVPGQEASMRGLFEAMAYLMVVAVPLLTMRLLSEEVRSGTIEKLMTAPVTDTAVILGKFLGVLAFYLVLLACTLVFLLLMAVYGAPDAGVAAMGYLGMVLLGAAFLSVGVFASTVTRYQLLAAIVGIAILATLAVMMQLIAVFGPEPWNALAARLNVMTYFRDFARGVLDTRGLVYFLSLTALFLFLSVKTLESRRWR